MRSWWAWKTFTIPETSRSCITSRRRSRPHNLFKRDVDYIVKEGQVIIVDEFTGRLMPGRRYSDGLHQALEAKNGQGRK